MKYLKLPSTNAFILSYFLLEEGTCTFPLQRIEEKQDRQDYLLFDSKMEIRMFWQILMWILSAILEEPHLPISRLNKIAVGKDGRSMHSERRFMFKQGKYSFLRKAKLMLLTFLCANSILIVGSSSDLIVRTMLYISPDQLGVVCILCEKDHRFEILIIQY